ncbi:interleukin-13 receptor subunit alpha-2 [Symphorus nematophorus]
MVKDLTALRKTGGFYLTEWMSNCRAVLAYIPEPERTKEVKPSVPDHEVRLGISPRASARAPLGASSVCLPAGSSTLGLASPPPHQSPRFVSFLIWFRTLCTIDHVPRLLLSGTRHRSRSLLCSRFGSAFEPPGLDSHRQSVLRTQSLVSRECQIYHKIKIKISDKPPFTSVGIDYIGPFEVKYNQYCHLEEDLHVKRRWKKVRYLSYIFWKRWTKEYLPLLQKRQKSSVTRRNLKAGDVILIVDDSAPRSSCPPTLNQSHKLCLNLLLLPRRETFSPSFVVKSVYMLMASKSWLTHLATLMLLVLSWRESMHCNGFTVDPPLDVQILDPGHLGYLNITWSLPTSLINTTECPKMYQLEYFNTYKDSWTAVRTPWRKFSAQFDLTKDIRVRVYTLLNGPCTNGTMIKSKTYTELVQKPSSTGVVGTAVQDFVCVYYNMKYVECTWGRSAKMPTNSWQNLYFWHRELEQMEECPKYLNKSGVRSGCNFTGISLPDFTDINFCINGSSAEGPLKSTFFSLQIQNHVKPETTERLKLQTGSDAQLELHWDRPVGKIPGHCLEWEVEHNQEGPDGKTASEQILTRQMSLTLPSIHDKEKHCFRVRSKLNKYCADKSFWSEWSQPSCHPEKEEIALEPEWDMVPVYCYIAVAIIAILVLSLCVGAVLKVRRSRQAKKPDSLLTTLFARNSLVTVAEA